MSKAFHIIKVPNTKWAKEPEAVADYLPKNYSILCQSDEGDIYITGIDDAGWTAEGYVIPRLGSAMIYAEVVIRIPV